MPRGPGPRKLPELTGCTAVRCRHHPACLCEPRPDNATTCLRTEVKADQSLLARRRVAMAVHFPRRCRRQDLDTLALGYTDLPATRSRPPEMSSIARTSGMHECWPCQLPLLRWRIVLLGHASGLPGSAGVFSLPGPVRWPPSVAGPVWRAARGGRFGRLAGPGQCIAQDAVSSHGR